MALREISLAETGGEKPAESVELKEMREENGDESDLKIKSSSLKRFFGITHKKKAAEISDALTKNERVLKKQVLNPAASEGDLGNPLDETESKAELKRFKLRFGTSKSNHQDLQASSSRLTLKSSLSGYFNSVFKSRNTKQISKLNDLETENSNDEHFEEKDTIEDPEKTFVVTHKENPHHGEVIDNILDEEIKNFRIRN